MGVERTSRTAGLAIWGDYAQFQTRDSLCLLLFHFISGEHRQRRWLCAFSKRSQCQCGCRGKHTFGPIFDVVGWMLRVCASGFFPEARHDGILFSDSKRPGDAKRASMAGLPLPMVALLLRKCGDWQWMKQSCALTGWRDGPERRCCYKCKADGKNHLWTDPSLHAAWRETVFGKESAAGMGIPEEGVWLWPGFHSGLCDIDWMHVADLGVLVVVLGNVFWEVFTHLGGTFANSKMALSRLLNMFASASKERH